MRAPRLKAKNADKSRSELSFSIDTNEADDQHTFVSDDPDLKNFKFKGDTPLLDIRAENKPNPLADGNDLVIFPMHNERWHAEFFQILREIRFRKRLDASRRVRTSFSRSRAPISFP
jgi:hypothetical protein